MKSKKLFLLVLLNISFCWAANESPNPGKMHFDNASKLEAELQKVQSTLPANATERQMAEISQKVMQFKKDILAEFKSCINSYSNQNATHGEDFQILYSIRVISSYCARESLIPDCDETLKLGLTMLEKDPAWETTLFGAERMVAGYFQVNKKNYVEALKIERVHYAKAALKPCSSGHTTSLLALLHLFQDTNNKSEFDKYWAIAKQCENSPNFEPKGQVFVLNSHGSVNLEYKNGPPAQAQMNPPIPAPQPPLGKGKKPKRVVAIIKFATKQCSEFWPGDECISYKVPDGWVIPGGFQLGPGEDPKKFCREMFYTKVTPMINPDFKPDPSCK